MNTKHTNPDLTMEYTFRLNLRQSPFEWSNMVNHMLSNTRPAIENNSRAKNGGRRRHQNASMEFEN